MLLTLARQYPGQARLLPLGTAQASGHARLPWVDLDTKQCSWSLFYDVSVSTSLLDSMDHCLLVSYSWLCAGEHTERGTMWKHARILGIP